MRTISAIVLSIIASLFISFGVMAYDPLDSGCAANPNSSLCTAKSEDVNRSITNITNTMLFLLGAVAVISIIIGGFMYVTAAGDPGKIKNAKNTILYSVIGLVVAILAWAIVSFTVRYI